MKPHRKDPYEPRIAIKIRCTRLTVEALDAFAEELKASRAHICDLILDVAMGEECEAFCKAVNDRMAAAHKRREARWRR